MTMLHEGEEAASLAVMIRKDKGDDDGGDREAAVAIE